MSKRRGLTHHDNATSLAQYDAAAQAAAEQVIGRYSTSFALGARLLPSAMRAHIAAIYAMVRIADEIVDTYRADDAGEVLARFRADVDQAMSGGYSANLVAHAFGKTAAAVGITSAQTHPFFDSMAMDLTKVTHTQESFDAYVFGSAAVIGEMCLAAFLNTDTGPRPLPDQLAGGARALGIAYQKVNFLRDFASDDSQLGRAYFPGVHLNSLTDDVLATLLDDCEAQIALTRPFIAQLPRRPRIAVNTTVDIYSRLLADIRALPAASLTTRRVRVRNSTKLVLAVRNVVPRFPVRRGVA